jgi:hypothetical protein
LVFSTQAAYRRQACTNQADNQTTQYLWHGGMIDAEIQNGQITKRYIFINLRAVAVIEYENDINNNQNSKKNDSASGNKYAGYRRVYSAFGVITIANLVNSFVVQ